MTNNVRLSFTPMFRVLIVCTNPKCDDGTGHQNEGVLKDKPIHLYDTSNSITAVFIHSNDFAMKNDERWVIYETDDGLYYQNEHMVLCGDCFNKLK